MDGLIEKLQVRHYCKYTNCKIPKLKKNFRLQRIFDFENYYWGVQKFVTLYVPARFKFIKHDKSLILNSYNKLHNNIPIIINRLYICFILNCFNTG